MFAFILAASGLIAISLLIRFLYRTAVKKGWVYPAGRKRDSSAVGIAALNLQVLFEPSKKYVLEAKQSRRKVDSKAGDPPHP
jgi:hypothetical protein